MFRVYGGGQGYSYLYLKYTEFTYIRIEYCFETLLEKINSEKGFGKIVTYLQRGCCKT